MKFPEDARRLEVERALGQLQSGKDPVEVMEALSRRLTNKLMHAPTRAIHELTWGSGLELTHGFGQRMHQFKT